MASIFKRLYTDVIKPIDTTILIVIMSIIFVIAGYFGYKWFVQSTVENLGTADLANDTSNREGDAELIFFFADWCPHCTRAKPDWDKFKNNFNNKKVGTYNLTCTDVDCSEGNSPLIQEYSVDGYPTVILKKDGERIDYDASISEDNLQQFITQFLEKN
jgi:thiol-disulfide isomerase/thioredoxin